MHRGAEEKANTESIENTENTEKSQKLCDWYYALRNTASRRPTMEELPLAGQVALVTGAARRIGRSIALELARAGADIVIHYRNSRSEAEATAAEIRALGQGVLVLQADVCSRKEVEAMFGSIGREWSRLDILVNNAATFFAAKFEELTDEQWDSIMDANLKSQFL